MNTREWTGIRTLTLPRNSSLSRKTLLTEMRTDTSCPGTTLNVYWKSSFPPKIYWFKDGKQISKRSEHYRINRHPDGTCSLHTAAASLDDDGNYTILAANPQVRRRVCEAAGGQGSNLYTFMCRNVLLPSITVLPPSLPQGRVSCTGRMMVQAVNQRGRSQRSTPGQMRRWGSALSPAPAHVSTMPACTHTCCSSLFWRAQPAFTHQRRRRKFYIHLRSSPWSDKNPHASHFHPGWWGAFVITAESWPDLSRSCGHCQKESRLTLVLS